MRMKEGNRITIENKTHKSDRRSDMVMVPRTVVIVKSQTLAASWTWTSRSSAVWALKVKSLLLSDLSDDVER